MALYQIRYKGLSDIREMSKKDLNKNGVGVDGMLRWERTNGWSCYVDNMSDRLEEILRNEGTFTITEVDDKTRREVKVIVDGKALDDTGATVTDATTGQKSKK